jgi:hypothetical protein
MRLVHWLKQKVREAFEFGQDSVGGFGTGEEFGSIVLGQISVDVCRSPIEGKTPRRMRWRGHFGKEVLALRDQTRRAFRPVGLQQPEHLTALDPQQLRRRLGRFSRR